MLFKPYPAFMLRCSPIHSCSVRTESIRFASPATAAVMCAEKNSPFSPFRVWYNPDLRDDVAIVTGGITITSNLTATAKDKRFPTAHISMTYDKLGIWDHALARPPQCTRLYRHSWSGRDPGSHGSDGSNVSGATRPLRARRRSVNPIKRQRSHRDIHQ